MKDHKLLIGIDGNEANIEKRVGVNMYAFELLCAIYKLAPTWKNRLKFVIYLKDSPRHDLPQEKEYWKYRIIPGKGLWIITKLMPRLFFDQPRPDIFWTPSHYVPPVAPMPRICSIMDLGYLKFSGQFRKYDYWQLTLWSAWSILVSRKLFSISESTKRDIVRHYPFAAKKIEVTPLAYDPKKFNTTISLEEKERVKKKYRISGNYILFLSTLKPSKNVEGLLKAYSSVSQDSHTQLVIAGKKGWMYDSIFRLVSDLKLDKRVIFTDYVAEENRPALIAGAKVFVLPSFWEGFGLDALAALACGVPVVVSRIGSLPEVVGDAGILVDPDKSEDIAAGIKKVLSMKPMEYNRLRELGLAQAKKFSWASTARKTLKVLESLK